MQNNILIKQEYYKDNFKFVSMVTNSFLIRAIITYRGNLFITNRDNCYHKSGLLLDITNRGKVIISRATYYKSGQICYRSGELLQIDPLIKDSVHICSNLVTDLWAEVKFLQESRG